MPVEAVWNDNVVAHSERTLLVEGNHYFPREDVDMSCLEPSETVSTCPWKGRAHYFNVEADGETCLDGAWHYPEPLPAAAHIAGHIAFWNGVEISEV